MSAIHLHVDPAAGASGDMVLGALLHLGVPVEVVDRAVKAVGVEARLQVRTEQRHGISGLKVTFVDDGGTPVDPVERGEEIPPLVVRVTAGGKPPVSGAVKGRARGSHDHSHDHAAAHGHHHPYGQVARRIEKANLRTDVRDMALAILRRLAVAESEVHGIPLEEVALHEVAAADSLGDMVGAAAALCHLKPARITVDAFGVAGGFVRMAHGVIPGPGPATGVLLKGALVMGLQGRMETVTPTGAAILTTVAHAFGPPPAMTLTGQGFGLGAKDPPERANLLRMWLGETGRTAHKMPPKDVVLLETNVDDATPQMVAAALEDALAAGALDAWVTPVVMKKGRPAWTLHVLATRDGARGLTTLLLRQTTALGVRAVAMDRTVATRESTTVTTAYGAVRIKVARLDGDILHATPEHDDCARLSRGAGVPLAEVHAAARAAYEGPAVRVPKPRRRRT